jgi:site-specific DNA recombinase
LEAEVKKQADEESQRAELRLVIGQLQEFANHIKSGLHDADWSTRREIVRALVKCVEVGEAQVRVIYRIDPLPFDRGPERGRLQDCSRRGSGMADVKKTRTWSLWHHYRVSWRCECQAEFGFAGKAVARNQRAW